MQEAETALGESPAPLAKAELLALRATILARQGSLSEAAQCAGEAKHLAGADRGQTGERAALAALRGSGNNPEGFRRGDGSRGPAQTRTSSSGIGARGRAPWSSTSKVSSTPTPPT